MEEQTYSGHRKRVKQKILQTAEHNPFKDYELLEAFLFGIMPRQDTKVLAKNLLKTFGSLNGVLKARPKDLKRVDGIGDNIAIFIRTMDLFIQKVLEERIRKQKILAHWEDLLNYLKFLLKAKTAEEIWVIFLKQDGTHIRDEKISEGSSNEAPLSIPLLLKKAIMCDAGLVILVHNHPTGRAHISAEDLELTKQAFQTLQSAGIFLFDHLLVAGDHVVSFKNKGLMPNISLS